MESLGKGIRALVKFIGYLGMASVVAIMLIMTVDVILRYFFNKPFLWSFDAVEYIMVLCVFFGIGYTEMNNGHVNITMVYDYFPSWIKPFVNVLNHLIMLFIGVLMTWQGYVLMADSYRVHRVSTGAVKIPEWPVDASIVIGATAFCLMVLVKIYDDLRPAKTKNA